MRRIVRFGSLVLVALLLFALVGTPAQALSRELRRALVKSSVLILAMQVQGGRVANIPWSGSGTIIDAKGLILTNNHVVQESNEWNTLGILVTTASDQKPEPAYLAEVVAADAQLDLAVIRIVADFKGNAVDPATLNLAPAVLGDADSLELGDEVDILGYPGIGAGTITYTEGKVSGFVEENGISYQRAWIKTDATISGGNSGGTAVDADGKLVGVPTRTSAVDVRRIADTNGDGVVDENDAAVPVGGFINLLRPVNLAFPLINRARNTTVSSGQDGPSNPVPRTPRTLTQEPSFTPFVFCTEVDADDNPANPGTSFPDPATRLYAYTTFLNMADGVAYVPSWSIDGETVSEETYSWEAGTSGTFRFSLANSGDNMPPGKYALEVFVGGNSVQTGTVQMGASTDPNGRPSQSTRGVTLSGYLYDAFSGDPIMEGYVLVLKPGVTVRQFLATQRQADVAAMGTTDADGYYTTTPLLTRGYTYSMVAAAQGYTTIGEDNVLPITDSDPEIVEMTDVEMAPE
jgi:serine protease Do